PANPPEDVAAVVILHRGNLEWRSVRTVRGEGLIARGEGPAGDRLAAGNHEIPRQNQVIAPHSRASQTSEDIFEMLAPGIDRLDRCAAAIAQNAEGGGRFDRGAAFIF